jgi:hypothetical protein
MAEIFETSVRLKFEVPVGEVDRIKKIVNASMSGGLKDKLGGMASMMGPKGMALAAGAAVAGALVVSSPSLQGTLKRLLRMVELIIKPIGDIISVGLRPIIDILRPIGQFFRILIQPYIRKAMEAMRLGRQFMSKGDYASAAASYALGVTYLIKPFFDMMITVATVSVQGILAGIKILGNALIALVPFSEDVQRGFTAMMDSAIVSVGVGGAKIITETSLSMEKMLTALKLHWKNIEDTANVSMGITSGFVGEGFVRIIQVATNFFAPSMTSTTNKMFDDIVSYAKTKVDELNALLNQPKTQWGTTAAWGGGAGGGYGASGSWGNNVLSTGGWYPTTNPFQDFIWRPGSKPVSISSTDTLIGTKNKGGSNITIDVGGIRIDKVSSDYDVNRIASQITDKVIDNLRSRV